METRCCSLPRTSFAQNPPPFLAHFSSKPGPIRACEELQASQEPGNSRREQKLMALHRGLKDLRLRSKVSI